MNLLEEIKAWNGIKHEIANLAKIEYQMREKIAQEILDGKSEGSKTATIDTVKVQATATVNYSVDRGELDLIKDDLSEQEWSALNFRPEVKLSVFRKLDTDSQLHNCVTAKPGKFQLKIVEDLG